MTLPRPRTLVLAVLVVLLVVTAAWWWLGRDRVTWTIEVDNANDVLDVDADRVLVDTFDEELVVLDREDGSVLGETQLPAGALIDQAALVPGGLVVAWSEDGEAHPVAQYDDAGRELWRRDDVERVLGLGADEAVVALRVDGATVGVGPDGQERWRTAGADGLSGPRAGGRELAGTHVTLAGGNDGGFEVVDLDDGAVRAFDTGGAGVDDVVYWDDAVLARLDDGGLAWSGGELDQDLRDGALGTVGDGAVGVATDDGWWGVDLTAGTVRELDEPTSDAYDSLEDLRLVAVPDGDDVRLVDVATAEEVTTYAPGGDVIGAYSGNDAVLLVEDVGRLTRWRHLVDREDAGRLTVLDRDGETHGSWVSTDAAVIGLYVADRHEAVVVTKDPTFDDPEPQRVTLLGR